MKSKIIRALTISLMLLIFVLLTACQQHKHAFGEWVVTTAATCKANGEKTRTCECGEKETETVAASEHNYAAATCKAPKTCSGCGATEGSPLPHQYADGVCTMCEEVEPAEQQKRLFRGAYLFLTTVEKYCDLMSSMIYDAWYFAIYQADDYGTGSEAITAFSRNVGINTDIVTEAIDSYLTSLKYTPSDRYRVAALRTNSGALYVVDYALTKDEYFTKVQDAFATAKEKIKEMDPAYASDNGCTEITTYYDALYAYFGFCYSPSGSFSQLSGTVNTYRSNAETARNKCSWYWDM